MRVSAVLLAWAAAVTTALHIEESVEDGLLNIMEGPHIVKRAHITDECNASERADVKLALENVVELTTELADLIESGQGNEYLDRYLGNHTDLVRDHVVGVYRKMITESGAIEGGDVNINCDSTNSQGCKNNVVAYIGGPNMWLCKAWHDAPQYSTKSMQATKATILIHEFSHYAKIGDTDDNEKRGKLYAANSYQRIAEDYGFDC